MWHSDCVNPVGAPHAFFDRKFRKSDQEGNDTKRVKAACICQTLHFQLKDSLKHGAAVRQVQEEVTHYRQTLDRSGTQYRILDEQPQADGSVILKVIKQYNQTPVGDYLK